MTNPNHNPIRPLAVLAALAAALACAACASQPRDDSTGDPEIRKRALQGAPPDPPPDQLGEMQREFREP